MNEKEILKQMIQWHKICDEIHWALLDNLLKELKKS